VQSLATRELCEARAHPVPRVTITRDRDRDASHGHGHQVVRVDRR
jgi:hypothetical protein